MTAAADIADLDARRDGLLREMVDQTITRERLDAIKRALAEIDERLRKLRPKPKRVKRNDTDGGGLFGE